MFILHKNVQFIMEEKSEVVDGLGALLEELLH